MDQETFLKLFGGTGTDFLNNSAELAAQKLATGLDNQITATGGEPPADAFNYFNNDFFNQDNLGITNTNVANNLNPNIVAAIDAQTADEQAQLPIDEVQSRGILDLIKSGGRKVLDFAAPIAKDVAGRTIASQALGGAGGMLFGLPGALLGTIFGGIKGGNLFDAPYIGGVTTVDEFGNLISGEELDKLNAAGGYYTDAARASRRRDKSIAAYRARGAEVKGRYQQLLEQQAKEESARQKEAAAIQEANRAAGTGGYQAGYSDDFMTGGDSQRDEAQEASSPGSSGPGGSDTMGSFRYGGIVGLL